MTTRLRNLSRVTTTAVATALAVSVGGSAFGYWTSGGLGTGQATAGTLNVATGVTVTAPASSSTTLNATWTAPSTGVTPTSYLVTAGAQSCTVNHPTTTCTVGGLSPSTGYSVVVTSRYTTSWTAAAAAKPGTTNASAGQAAPTSVTVTNCTYNRGLDAATVTLTWTPAAGATSQLVYLGATNDTSTMSLHMTINDNTTTTSTASFTTNATTVYFAVSAKSGTTESARALANKRVRFTDSGGDACVTENN